MIEFVPTEGRPRRLRPVAWGGGLRLLLLASGVVLFACPGPDRPVLSARMPSDVTPAGTGSCSCTPVGPLRLFPNEPGDDCGPFFDRPDAGQTGPISLHLTAVEPCVVGFRSGRCASIRAGELQLEVHNSSDRRIVVAAQDAPTLFVTGWPVPFDEATACWSEWGYSRGSRAIYDRTFPLDGALLLEPDGGVTVFATIDREWSEMQPACVSGWHSFRAALPSDDVEPSLLWSPPSWAGTRLEPDWPAVLRRLDPRFGADFPSDPHTYGLGPCNEEEVWWAPAAAPACAPPTVVSDLFGSACLWPCGGLATEVRRHVVSNEVSVWIEADVATSTHDDCVPSGEPAQEPVVPSEPFRLELSGPTVAYFDEEQELIDLEGLGLAIRGGSSGMLVDVSPYRTLRLSLIALDGTAATRNCTWASPIRWWPQQFAAPVPGYHIWSRLRRLPTDVAPPDLSRWLMLAPPAAACPVEGRYRIVASLVSTRADHILVFPDDPWFETAASLADAVVRTGVDGAPALVELPSRGLKVGHETLTVWGADAAEGEVLFVQSNPIDVQLVLRPAPASAETSTSDQVDDGAETAP